MPLRLVLGPEPLSIEGRVLDEEGKPRAGVKVTLFDATEFGYIPTGTPGSPNLMGTSVEGLLAGGSNSEQELPTGEDGHFHLEGLLARDYRLRVLDPSTLQVTLSAPIPAGRTKVEIVLPEPEDLSLVAGHILDIEGHPLPNVSVFLSRNIDAASLGADGDV